MSTRARTNDTLYDDPCDQMCDYEVVLAESGGIQMAIALLHTKPDESGQSPHGIWGLFGIEAILSAAGSPSLNDSCGFLREWGKSMDFRPSPSLIVEMKSCLDGIFKSREMATEFPEALPEDAAEILATMIRRIEGLPVSEGGREEPNIEKADDKAVGPASPPIQSSPPPKTVANPDAQRRLAEARLKRSALPPICASSHSTPPWWPELLEFTAKIVRESLADDASNRWIAQLSNIAAVDQMEDHIRFLSYTTYKWSPCSRVKQSELSAAAQERIQAEFEKTGKWPLDRKPLVYWLTERLNNTDAKGPTPLECLLNPSILANSPESRSYPDHVKGEAYGALIEAVSKRTPVGLGKLLPGLNSQHAQFFSDSGPPDFRAMGDRVVRILFEEWTSIPSDGSTDPLPEVSSFPVDFWNELKGLFTGKFAFPTHFTGSRYRDSILFQAFWSAWTAGDCTVETYDRIYTLERYGLFMATFSQIRELKAGNPGIIEFTKVHERNLAAIVRKLVGECLRNDDWKNLDALILDYRAKRGIEFLSIAAKKLLAGASIDDIESLVDVEILNPDDDLEEVRRHLSALPQKTLKQLLPNAGLGLPLVLDLIEDRKLVDTLRVILGTFSEPLMPDTSDDFAEIREATQLFHPGRTACGTTDFNPFYEAMGKCPKSVMDEIFKIVGNSVFSIVEGGSTRLKLYAGLPVREKDAEKDRSEIRSLSHRLPADPAKRELELDRRVRDLVAYVQQGDRPKLDFIFEWLLHELRDAAYLWAEAASQPSWTEAAFDLARRTRCVDPLDFEGCTLKQSPQVHPGYTVLKKGKPLTKLPPAIAKAPEVRSFTDLAHFHRLMAMLLRLTFLSNRLRTGEEPDMEFCKNHLSVFGIDPRDWLRERAALRLPDASRQVIRKCMEYLFNDPTGKGHDGKILAILPDFEFSPTQLFPKLLESHWLWEFDSGPEFYQISPRFGCGVHFGFSIRFTNSRWEGQKSSRLPTEPFRLNLDKIRFRKEIRPDDPIWDRLVDRVLQDLVLASSDTRDRAE